MQCSFENLTIVKINGIISTDDIIPAIYKHKFTEPCDLARYIFANKFPQLLKAIKPNSVIIADSTFGIGSSREQAVSALKAAGVSAIIAPRFGRIFFRNCWNLGVPAIESDLSSLVEKTLHIDLSQHQIILPERSIGFNKIPNEFITICNAGGLLSGISGI